MATATRTTTARPTRTHPLNDQPRSSSGLADGETSDDKPPSFTHEGARCQVGLVAAFKGALAGHAFGVEVTVRVWSSSPDEGAREGWSRSHSYAVASTTAGRCVRVGLLSQR